MRLLSRAGEEAAKGQPQLAERFKLPSIRLTNRAYITAAQSMVAEAGASKDAFVQAGMPEGLLAELSQMLAEYGQATEKAVGGRRDHVGARADLSVVAEQIVAVVRILDGLNRHRFQTDPEVLAAWISASKVIVPHRDANGAAPSDGSGGPEPPPTGSETPQSVAA